MDSTNADARAPRARHFLVVLALTGCAILSGVKHLAVPRQGWSERWGPLVPHETFPGDCSVCHVPDRWDVIKEHFTYDHAKETGHVLNGAHADAACLRCHNDFGPVANYVARGCAGCHADPHQARLTNDCTRCHGETTWRPQGVIAEHARTGFPLAGAHVIAACDRCHTRAPTGDFRGAPRECAVCHRDDRARARSPNHVANGWTTRCERCHTPTAWEGAGIVHDFFPLLGGHALDDCTRCHIGGNFTPLPTNCISCHRDDYDRAPNHEGFPQNCEECHTIQTWRGATFNHRFPLRGEHNVNCNVCHPTTTQTFTCLVCHERNETGSDHDEVRGYVYQSAACLQCHPNGDE